MTAYASAHPWEDFAETWAHYFHMVDTLETANASGLSVRPKLSKSLAAKIDFDPHGADLDRIIEAWLPLTFAVNSINRSMGLPDLYPFVLAPSVIGKAAFVHAAHQRAVRAQDRPPQRTPRHHRRPAQDRSHRRIEPLAGWRGPLARKLL